MRRLIGPWLAGTFLLTAASAAAEVNEFDRFALWNECRPMHLAVEDLDEDSAEIGLSKEALEIAARSRLRAARLYSEDFFEGSFSYLYINVTVSSRALSISVEYKKSVMDLATKLEVNATTWKAGSVGTHGRDAGYILSAVSQHTDEFIDEYLRVNETACD